MKSRRTNRAAFTLWLACAAWMNLAAIVRGQAGETAPADSPKSAGATETGEATEPAQQEDPTRAVFFSLRNEFLQVNDDTWANAFILRSDRTFLRSHPRLSGKAGILTRFDLPIVATHIAKDDHLGLGDLYAQAALVPWLTRRSAFVIGSGVTLPTASGSTLGAGKWQIAPVVAPVWFLPHRRGLFFVRLHDHLSFAGDNQRADVHYLEIVPTLIWNYRPAWWALATTNVIVDWEHGGETRPSAGLEIGHVLHRAWGLAVRPELFWGANPRGDWKVTLTLTRYRRK